MTTPTKLAMLIASPTKPSHTHNSANEIINMHDNPKELSNNHHNPNKPSDKQTYYNLSSNHHINPKSNQIYPNVMYLVIIISNVITLINLINVLYP